MRVRDSKTVRAWPVLRLLLALGVGLLPTLGWAEDPAPVPDHAYIDSVDHWKCDRGFKRVTDRCEEIQVPEHAFLNHDGKDWKCERGYKRVKEQCQRIQVPEHAFLGSTGNRWKCERGYKRVNDQCQRVQVPEHAFLDTWGDGWECERGFRRSGNRCAPK